MWDYQLYIDGKWTDGQGDDEITVLNPATEDKIGRVPGGSVADAQTAITAARKAFDEGPWAYMKPAERGAKLKKMADILQSRHDELRALIQAQTGVAGPMLDMVQCGGAIGIGHYNADEVQRVVEWVESSPPTGGPQGMAGSALVREPVGVVAAITPFNFPFMLNMVKAFPAMAVGCSVVLKPHPWTPLDAFEMAKAAEEAEIPPGVFNVITGHADVGDELTGNPAVDMITFTGSTATGRHIMARAAQQIKRVQLELGGKSAQILLDDVPETVAQSIGFGMALVHCGQGCALTTRLLVPEPLMDAYLDGVHAMKEHIKWGDPAADPSVNLGPLIREQQRERVHSYVESGLEQGATLVTGGRKADHNGKGFFYEPTVLVGTNDMRIAQEEIFGPVLTAIPYSGKDEDAIRLANDSIYGLSGSVMAANTARAFNVARRIRAGSLTATGVAQPPAGDPGQGGGQGPGWGEPMRGIAQGGAFGGFKQSGIGREWGRHGLEDFTEVKSISWS
ncbi:MAG: aldehyde dehydrogenase family protein [Pseudomonadales bacterium]|nr:aldehyde dehydrogenase family protein [Pseudomonadales bacterium]